MSERAPYSRVYWSVMHDAKFDGVREDPRLIGSWLLLLIQADMAHPSPAYLLPTVSRASVGKLVNSGLIDLLDGHRYRIRGLDAERERRRVAATNRDPNGTRVGGKRDPNGSSRAGALLVSSRTTSGDTTAQERARDPEGPVLEYLASVHAAIAPTGNGYHLRLVKLVERHGAEAVLATMRHLHDTGAHTDRQLLFGTENSLDAIPASRNGTKTKGYAPSAEEAERAFR